MFKFLFLMIIPVIIFIYTMSFTRWLFKRTGMVGTLSAAALGIVSISASAATLWKLVM